MSVPKYPKIVYLILKIEVLVMLPAKGPPAMKAERTAMFQEIQVYLNEPDTFIAKSV